MAVFPTRQTDVSVLATRMKVGYESNPTVFPNADVPTLVAAISVYSYGYQASILYDGLARLKTEEKDVALAALIEKMQLELKQSEVDTASNPVQLDLIGWGEKAAASPTVVPGQARSLDAANQGDLGALTLDWKAPAPGEGGSVKLYVIERREGDPVKGPTTWHQCGASFYTKTELLDQPQRQELEYRVKAMNNAGEGLPTNTVAVVL